MSLTWRWDATPGAQVIKWSDGSYLEDQDMWWLSGIHRWEALQGCSVRWG